MARSFTQFLPVLALMCACEATVPTELFDPGDPCNARVQVCIDDESALSCEDRVWEPLSCDELCARIGPSFVPDGCELGCVCVPVDPDGCVPGETTCIDDATLGACDDVQVLEAFACADLCEQQELASVGCVPAVEFAPGLIEPAQCWCTNEGTACDADEPASCVDDTTLASCMDGVWVFEDCADSCGQTGAQCDPWQTPGACGC